MSQPQRGRMASPTPSRNRKAIFGRLGGFIVRRKYAIIAAWIMALVVIIPVINSAGNVTSLQQGSASGNNLESLKAGNIITARFGKEVPNSSLIVVITARNVSSPQTQDFISSTVQRIKSDSRIRGIQNVTSVYSILYPIINGTNRGAYRIHDAANGTIRLLFGVPALYVKVWGAAFAQTHSVPASNRIAYNQSAAILSKGNETLFRSLTSHLLDLFSSSWSTSWTDPSTGNSSVVQRASNSADVSGRQFLTNYLPASKDFGETVLNSFTLGEYVTDTPKQASSRLSTFAVKHLSDVTGFSTDFVNATFSLGRRVDTDSLKRLAGNVVWSPGSYNAGSQIETLVASLVSSSRNTTLISIGLDHSSNGNLLAIRQAVHSLQAGDGPSSGVQSTLVTGNDAVNYDFSQSTQADLGIILPVTIILLIVATGVFFRSALTPFITLGTIGVALGIAYVFIVLVGTFVAKVDFTIPTVLITVLIGVGTDYSVFILARYREERVRGLSVTDAIVTSVTWAGESIATSGATVIISFLALSLTSIVYLRTMGMVVGLGVLVALLVALTLVPAIVTLVGGRTFWPNSGKRFAKYSASVLSKLEKRSGYFSRSGSFSVRRAKLLILLAVLVSLPTLYIYANTTPTYDFLSGAPRNLEAVNASDHLTSAFGGGRLFPTYVVVTFSRPLWNGTSFNSVEMNSLQQISSYVSSNRDVLNVSGPTMPFGSPVNYTVLKESNLKDAQTIGAMRQSIGSDDSTALLTLKVRIDPFSTQAIADAQEIRSTLHQRYDNAPGVTGIYVGGASGGILDTRNVFNGQFNSVIPIVAVGVAFVLLVVLGSLFLPLFAVVSVLMSIIWTLAVTGIVFKALYNYGLLFITPLFLFVTLLGLGMDYNVFILTRIREEATKGQKLNDAIVRAIEQTGGIITAAAIILAGSLGALLLSNHLLLKQIGFAFSFSILIDALVVRTYLVPAVMSSLGRWNWYDPIPLLNRSKALFEKKD